MAQEVERTNRTKKPKTKEVVCYGVQNVETGEFIGKLRVLPASKLEKKLRKDKQILMTFALVVGIGLGAVSAVAVDNHIEAKHEEAQIAYEQRMEEAREIAENDEPVFIVEHVVKYGQSYWGIAESMYDDGNSQKEAYDDMVSLNKDSSPSMLRAGTTIKVPVPASQLENFGYTVDYSILKPEIELNDRLEFINNYIKNFIPADKTQTAVLSIISSDVEDLRTLKEQIDSMGDGSEKDALIEEAVIASREICVVINDQLYVYIDGKDDTVGVHRGDFDAPRAYEMNEENLRAEYLESKTLG